MGSAIIKFSANRRGIPLHLVVVVLWAAGLSCVSTTRITHHQHFHRNQNSKQ